jgi:hypothetical protein
MSLPPFYKWDVFDKKLYAPGATERMCRMQSPTAATQTSKYDISFDLRCKLVHTSRYTNGNRIFIKFRRLLSLGDYVLCATLTNNKTILIAFPLGW